MFFDIHVISPYFWESPYFSANLPIWNFKISLNYLYISLFQISDLPIWKQEFSSLFNHSPYFILKSKSPYLASQMYHMYMYVLWK